MSIRKIHLDPVLIIVAALVSTVVACSDASAQASEPTMPHTVTPTVYENVKLVQHYQETIRPRELAAQLFFFSSDYFEGRETASRGQKFAAEYLASQYRKLGLEPKGTMAVEHPYAPEAYFQRFRAYGTRLREARLDVMVQGDTVGTSIFSARRQDDLAYLLHGSLPEASGGVVFAGYGISDVDLEYDDYRALEDYSVSFGGKWLLVLDDEPLADAETSLLPTPNSHVSVWSRSIHQKLRAAFQRGIPKGFLVVGDTSPRAASDFAERSRAAAAALENRGRLSVMETAHSMPVYMISSKLADQILGPSGRSVRELKAQIDESLTPVVFELPGVSVASRLRLSSYTVETENVLAFIPGSDPEVRDEVVVLSAHYDHIGIEAGFRGDRINNGADDNGSGTVALLEVAEAFMKAREDGHGPRRSLLFLHLTGEENGLLGSEYYADVNAVLPIERTVTNLNVDMIGRHDPTRTDPDSNYVYIIGSRLISEELHEINQRVNELTGTGLFLDERFNSRHDPNQFYARSDHWHFGKPRHGVPFIFFFTGIHEDYHRPTDEADKIDYDRLARIARLIFATAWQVANQDSAPAVSGGGFH